MIELYGCGSPNVFKVMLMLSELDLPYRLHRVDMTRSEQFGPELTALNPNQKVPVIVDPEGPDGESLTVFESGAILMYLAEKTGRFWPVRMADRYRVIQWLMFQMANVGPMFGQGVHFVMHVPTEEHEYSRRRYLTQVRRLYDVMERQLAGNPYLAGDEYSIADIATYPWAGRLYKTFGVTLEHHRAVARWKDAIKARPAVERIRKLVNDMTNSELAAIRAADPDAVDRFMARGRYAKVRLGAPEVK